jgi:hypothetical protein
LRIHTFLLAAVAALAACDSGASTQPEAIEPPGGRTTEPAPSGVITTTVAGLTGPVSLYPYTRTEFAAGDDFDPVNLVFVGFADPRSIRAVLLGLDGGRTAALGASMPGYPAVAPFNCRWHDAIGDMQTAYGGDDGWVGSVVQLACGDFGPVRFHLRLFRLGGFTVANAHFEMLIPGTADHQVLSWERAEAFVSYDLLRSGAADPASVAVTDVINTETHRTILKDLWNGLVASGDGQALLAFVRPDLASPAPAVEQDEPIRNGDGRATVIRLTARQPLVAGTYLETVPIDYDQDIPRPFCPAVPRFMHVSGHLDLVKRITIDAHGKYRSDFSTSGTLSARDLATGVEYSARIADHQESTMSDDEQTALATVERRELPAGQAPNGYLFTRLQVGPAGLTQFERQEECGS